MVAEAVLSAVRNFCKNKPNPWVLFKNFSVVVLEAPKAGKSLEEAATEIMESEGPVYAGTPHGDFNVVALENKKGWIITSHCKDLFTYVSPEEVPEENPAEIAVGLFGRGKRHEDSQNLEIIHLEEVD